MADALRVLTLNIAHGARSPFPAGLLPRSYLRSNVEAIARLLREQDADLVALQEVDRASFWSGGLDHLDLLAEKSGYPHRIHGEHRRVDRGPLKMNVGTALLSRRPFLETRVHRFNVGTPNDKGFVLGRVQLGRLRVGVVSVHLGLSAASRVEHFRQMVEQGLGRGGEPEVIAGDLNCVWHEERGSARELAEAVKMSAPEPDGGQPTLRQRRIDWILVPPALRISEYRVLPDRVSDHRAVVATVVVD